MKILQLCKKFPWPLKDGESIASTYMARALNDLGCEVTLLAMNTSKHRANLEQLPASFDHYRAVYGVEVDNHLHPLEALQNLLFSKESYHVNRFENEDYKQKLIEILQNQEFDIIHLETLFLSPYLPVIREYSRAKVVMRSHNVEHKIWERVASNSHPLKRWYLNTITPRLREYEISHLNSYDLFAAITAGDLAEFEALGLRRPAMVMPIGIDTADYTPDFAAYEQAPAISFIGSLDWMPNLEGLYWFIKNVWEPLILPRYPQLTFHIAGRNTPERLFRLKVPGIVVHGEVESARAFLNAYPVTVAPLLSGGGMRAKILEGMALGRVVISTSVGMEGIEVEHGQQAILADTPEAWLDAIEWCINHPEGMRQMGEQAAQHCRLHYDNLLVARQLISRYQELINEPADVQV